jgi:hypothetical protein
MFAEGNPTWFGTRLLNLTIITIPSEAFGQNQASSHVGVTSPKKQANSGRLRKTAAQNLSFLGFRNSSPNLVGFFSSGYSPCLIPHFNQLVQKHRTYAPVLISFND